MLWNASAVHSLPVALLDVIIAVFLAQLVRSGPRSSSAQVTRHLAAWFGLLALLNGSHVVTCILTDPRASFVVNHIGQSVAVLMSIVPLIAFSYAFVEGESLVRERRVAMIIATGAASALSLAFVCETILTPDQALYFRAGMEHTQARGLSQLGAALSLTVLLGYAHACGVLVRKGLRSSGRDRASIWAFAGIAAAAVVAVLINRLEGAEVLPTGSYTTWTLLSMAAAVVVYMGHSDELTSFAERIVGITLALFLVVLAAAGELTVRMRAGREDAVREAVMARAEDLWNAGRTADAERVAGAVASAEPGGPARSISETVINERFIAQDGSAVVFRFPYIARARAIHPLAAGVASAMVAATILSLLTLRRLFDRSVLAPLRSLERASAASRAKSMFLAQLSHELRTPLSAVVGHARTLEAAPLGEHDRTRVRSIAHAGEHLLALVEGLLEEGKADLSVVVARREEVSIRKVLQAVADLARARAHAASTEVVVDVAEDVPLLVSTDARLLRQVLLNLLTNAVKHTTRGRVTCAARRRGSVVELSVEDNGVGIAPADQARIFDAFHQVTPGDGAGLGLAIVKHLADALGTEVRVESALGAGARFSFVLPIDPPAAETPPAPVIVVPEGATRGELRELALIGDVVGLQERARALAATDPRYQGFAGRVDVLAGAYQVRALQALLEDEA
jgi:signal transduction histidine kinase